ncbi:MAG: HupE/UreJ family protein [Bacteroidota bacterium]
MNSSVFSVYAWLGFEHIADLDAYDHAVFLLALCAIYRLREWKQVLILVTAFTIGHSVTLALAVLDLLRFPAFLVEMLIPITIILSSLYNVWQGSPDSSHRRSPDDEQKLRFNYVIALLFGLIHGMGFSNFLRSSLMPGQEDQLWQQLLSFNLGIELGQVLIVGFVLLMSYLAMEVARIRQHSWNLFVSGAAAGIALVLLMGVLRGG